MSKFLRALLGCWALLRVVEVRLTLMWRYEYSVGQFQGTQPRGLYCSLFQCPCQRVVVGLLLPCLWLLQDSLSAVCDECRQNGDEKKAYNIM